MNKSTPWKMVCTAVILFAVKTVPSQAQTLTTLVNFDGSYIGSNGSFPYAPLVQGSDGNFYGEAGSGGAFEYGTVFKMTRDGSLTTLHSFNGLDGADPSGGLIQATDGNFYGTTETVGTVFRMTSDGTLTTLYAINTSFGNSSGLVQAADGNLYGVFSTAVGGYQFFRITLGGTLTIVHTFIISDGVPEVGPIQAADGNFYGVTYLGGPNGGGTVYKMTPSGALTTLHGFSGADGSRPVGGLIQATDGNFYGTTSLGGVPGPLSSVTGGGTVFKITPEGVLTTLHSFTPVVEGSLPEATLVQAADGNFYGTTALFAGTIFEITPGGALTTLHSFSGTDGNVSDDMAPSPALIQATDGNLYGTTIGGGAGLAGTVFKLTLASSTPAPAIGQTSGVLNGASFQAGITTGSWITIYGTSLSSRTDSWANAIVNGALPTILDGVSVSIGGLPAYVAFVSPTQINAVAPNVAPGTVPVTVTTASVTSAPVSTVVQAAQPAFFLWPGNYAVATTQSYTLAVKNGTFSGLTTTPAAPGETIILWGTGFGPTSPSAPAGAEVPSSTTYNTANTVTVTVGGSSATVYGAALAPGFAGLYQVAIQIPASLANGDYPVIATVLGAQSPSTALITVQE